MSTHAAIHIRLARADDEDFIVALAPRFFAFDLPPWRQRSACIASLREELASLMADTPANSHLFVAEDDDGLKLGFLHVQTTRDPVGVATNCHIADIACADGRDGNGIGSALLGHALQWARDHHCRHVTLAVFPGNERAQQLYLRHGFGVEALRMVRKVD